jgi:hypothetical protein
MADYIYEAENIIENHICKDIIDRFENDPRKRKGETIGGVSENVKVSIDLPLGLNDELKDDWWDLIIEITDSVRKFLFENYIPYLKENNLDKNNSIENTICGTTIGIPQLQKTEKGGFYRWHHDGYLNRVFTYILYLNDVEEGCGGTTDFLCGKSVVPKAGKIVIFPSSLTYIHRGKKLEKGVKYIATSFIYEGDPILYNTLT